MPVALGFGISTPEQAAAAADAGADGVIVGRGSCEPPPRRTTRGGPAAAVGVVADLALGLSR